MSFQETRSDELTLRQAADLTDRTYDSVKTAVRTGALVGTRTPRGWVVTRAAVLAWNEAHPKRLPWRSSGRQWERAAELLEQYGPMSSDELGILLDRHRGNVNKYLAILAHQERAERRPDGQWILIQPTQAGAA